MIAILAPDQGRYEQVLSCLENNNITPHGRNDDSFFLIVDIHGEQLLEELVHIGVHVTESTHQEPDLGGM